MKTQQPTKEQLTAELIKLRDSHANWVAADERRRKEFAKAFNWIKNIQRIGYSHIEQEPQLPSWEQIFVQLGKLLVLEELKQKVIVVSNPPIFPFPTSPIPPKES